MTGPIHDGGNDREESQEDRQMTSCRTVGPINRVRRRCRETDKGALLGSKDLMFAPGRHEGVHPDSDSDSDSGREGKAEAIEDLRV